MSEGERHPVIRISNLSKRFGKLTAVDRLSLDIYPGEVLGFLGPNGAGKTTTINMICGLTQPTEGAIDFWDGALRDVNDIKAQIGICPQENIHWPKLTCREQLIFMGEMYGLSRPSSTRSADQLLDLLGLADKADVWAGKLSGGMKRRLNICLALIHDPSILILDEPEAGLDPQSRILVRTFIRTLAREKTIILTTHNMDEADRLADRVAIIDHGRLLLLDTPERLKRSTGEGDILELHLDVDDAAPLDLLVDRLSSLCDEVRRSGSTLQLKALHLIDAVAEITRIIRAQGYTIKAIQLRENTLEDVFIHLTGRKLRP